MLGQELIEGEWLGEHVEEGSRGLWGVETVGLALLSSD